MPVCGIPFFPVLFVIGFGLCLFLLYNLMPLAMKLSSATVVNLSLLTADFYSLFCGLFLFHYKVSYGVTIAITVVTGNHIKMQRTEIHDTVGL